jgi:uncharacterized membrane protein YgaE (UPF0421/DUF939 family)
MGSLFRRGAWEHSVRTAVAALLSLVVARLLGLPQPYWAPISTLVVTQSTLGAAWNISRQRFLGTAVGSASGAFLTPFLGSGAVVFASSILGLGIVCAGLRLDRSAYRFAAITLAIVMLASGAEAAWIVAMDRFVEVSVGIAIALALTAVWGEHGEPVP